MAPNIQYYNPQGSILHLFRWFGTVFEFVLTKSEFWMYVALHVLCVVIVDNALQDMVHADSFNWDAAWAMQVLMTFFITFYNDLCYNRYMELYPACNRLMNSVVFFVHELNVSCHYPEVRPHRVACTKYLLTLVFEYHMVVTGGKLTKDSWKELVKKGLITKPEVEMLSQYPTGRVSLILTTWVLLILKDALTKDCFFQANKSQQASHIFNRHSQHIVGVISACNRVSSLMAMPIPFAYYHLMNVILLFNIILMATAPALMRNYWTVLPFSIALLIYMGLREVTSALADPFGTDVLDFPVALFINHTFDRAACLLEVFSDQQVRDRIIEATRDVEDFTDDQLRRKCTPKVMYDIPGFDDEPKKKEHQGGFLWSRPTSIHEMPYTPPIDFRLRQCLIPKENQRKYKIEEDEDETRPALEALKRQLEQVVEEIRTTKKENEHLDEEIANWKAKRIQLHLDALGEDENEEKRWEQNVEPSQLPAVQKRPSMHLSQLIRGRAETKDMDNDKDKG